MLAQGHPHLPGPLSGWGGDPLGSRVFVLAPASPCKAAHGPRAPAPRRLCSLCLPLPAPPPAAHSCLQALPPPRVPHTGTRGSACRDPPLLRQTLARALNSHRVPTWPPQRVPHDSLKNPRQQAPGHMGVDTGLPSGLEPRGRHSGRARRPGHRPGRGGRCRGCVPPPSRSRRPARPLLLVPGRLPASAGVFGQRKRHRSGPVHVL